MKTYLVLYKHYDCAGFPVYDRDLMDCELEGDELEGDEHPTLMDLREWEEQLKKQHNTRYSVSILSFSEVEEYINEI